MYIRYSKIKQLEYYKELFSLRRESENGQNRCSAFSNLPVCSVEYLISVVIGRDMLNQNIAFRYEDRLIDNLKQGNNEENHIYRRRYRVLNSPVNRKNDQFFIRYDNQNTHITFTYGVIEEIRLNSKKDEKSLSLKTKHRVMEIGFVSFSQQKREEQYKDIIRPTSDSHFIINFNNHGALIRFIDIRGSYIMKSWIFDNDLGRIYDFFIYNYSNISGCFLRPEISIN